MAQRGREGAFLMPVLHGADIEVPPLLAAWAPLLSSDIEGIDRAIVKHAGIDVGDAPALGKRLRLPHTISLELVLRREGSYIVAGIGAPENHSFMPVDEAREVRDKLRGAGLTRDRGGAAEGGPLAEVGRRLGKVLAGRVGASLAAPLDPRANRAHAVLRVRADAPDLLVLPWEAARIDGLDPLALIPRTTILRVAPSAAKYRPTEVTHEPIVLLLDNFEL